MNTEIVAFDSELAAKYHTGLSGWVSRNGFYFGDGPHSERDARYNGCTHTFCRECNALVEKGLIRCKSCFDKLEIANYKAMPRKQWDGKTMLYSRARDLYYDSPEDAVKDLQEGDTLDCLRLVLCRPNYATPLESDYFCDDLPEGGCVPDALAEAIDAFNKAASGIILSLSPGEFALDTSTMSLLP